MWVWEVVFHGDLSRVYTLLSHLCQLALTFAWISRLANGWKDSGIISMWDEWNRRISPNYFAVCLYCNIMHQSSRGPNLSLLVVILCAGEEGAFLPIFPPASHLQLWLLFILEAHLKTSLEGPRALFLWHCTEDVETFVPLKWHFLPLHTGYFPLPVPVGCSFFFFWWCRHVSSTMWKEERGSGLRW